MRYRQKEVEKETIYRHFRISTFFMVQFITKRGPADILGWCPFFLVYISYLCSMKTELLLRAILPDVLIDNFDIVSFEKKPDRFDIFLDEKKVQLKEDKTNPAIIAYGFGEYRTIQDYPIRGRSTYLHVRKRKWLDKSSNEIFSYDWDLSEFEGTRLNAEFVSFLKEGD